MDNYKPAIKHLVESYLLQQYGTMLGILGKEIDETQAACIIELMNQNPIMDNLTDAVYDEMCKDEQFKKNEKGLVWLYLLSKTVNDITIKVAEVAAETKFVTESAGFAKEILQYLGNKDKAN